MTVAEVAPILKLNQQTVPLDLTRNSGLDPLSGLPSYPESDSPSNDASGGVVLGVRIIRAL